MKILIVNNPVVTGGSIVTDNYRKALQALAGQWVEVETQYLFQDQFNTKDLRIMSRHVADIQDDVRENFVFDGWTGKKYKNRNSVSKKVRNRTNKDYHLFVMRKHPHGDNINLVRKYLNKTLK
jgi:hypothetical protein